MTSPRRILDRICAHCGRNDGHAGPRPYGSALKMVGGELAYACSTFCSERLGWSDRPPPVGHNPAGD